jgi:hypothetical protein
MSTHLYPEVAAHVMRVTETAHWLEWQDWADPVMQKPYEIRDGLLHIPDVPAVCLEWNEEVVAGLALRFPDHGAGPSAAPWHVLRSTPSSPSDSPAELLGASVVSAVKAPEINCPKRASW